MAAGYHIGQPPIWCLSLAYGSSLPLNGIPHCCVSLLHSRANIFWIYRFVPDILLYSPKAPQCLWNIVLTLPWNYLFPDALTPYTLTTSEHWGDWKSILPYPPSLCMEVIPFSLTVSAFSCKTQLKHHLLYKSSLITSPTGYPGHPCIIVFVIC